MPKSVRTVPIAQSCFNAYRIRDYPRRKDVIQFAIVIEIPDSMGTSIFVVIATAYN